MQAGQRKNRDSNVDEQHLVRLHDMYISSFDLPSGVLSSKAGQIVVGSVCSSGTTTLVARIIRHDMRGRS